MQLLLDGLEIQLRELMTITNPMDGRWEAKAMLRIGKPPPGTASEETKQHTKQKEHNQ